jgi:uncharacterized protein YecT (DUF1311 family)
MKQEKLWHPVSAFIGLLAIPLMSFSTSAQEPVLSKIYSACMEKSGGVTSNMLDCADKEIDAQEKRLNTAYQALLKETAAKRKEELRKVQRLWVTFRKANCDFYEDPDRGTSAALATSSCYLTSTANRAKELEDLKLE